MEFVGPLADAPDELVVFQQLTKERAFCVVPFLSTEDTTTGDGTIGFVVPAMLDGLSITDVVASVHTAGTTGTIDIQIRRRRDTTDADVLTTKVSVDSAETRSTTAAVAFVVNGANDDLSEGDIVYADVDAVQTTAAKGLSVTVTAG